MKNGNIHFFINKLNIFRNSSIYEIGQAVGLNPLFHGPNLGTTEIVKSMISHLDLTKILDQLTSEDVSLKTVRLKENNTPKEAMSFNAVNFNELIQENWETSFIRRKFAETTFLFVVFQYNEDVLYFRGALAWECPTNILENEIRQFWLTLQHTVLNRVIITPIKQANSVIFSNNLPGSKDNPVMHVRPKAANGNDTILLPDGQSITKQAYWFNTSFVAEIVNSLAPLKIDTQLHQQNSAKLTAEQIEHLATIMTKGIYTIEDFYTLAQKNILNFSINMITPNLIKALNYKIAVPYIFHKKYKTCEHYFEQNLFNATYFTIEDEAIFEQSAFNKIIEKRAKTLAIIEIEPKSYITQTGLTNANISSKDLNQFKEFVAIFTKNYSFFTYEQIVEDGFYHPLQELGFDNIFYESILKNSKLFSYCELHKVLFFKLGNQKFNLSSFYLELLKNEHTEQLSLNSIHELLNNQYKLSISYDQLVDEVKHFKINPFYSPELERFFINEHRYYDYLDKH